MFLNKLEISSSISLKVTRNEEKNQVFRKNTLFIRLSSLSQLRKQKHVFQ